VGDLTTRYRRTGAGRPVVVLHTADDPDSHVPDLAELLSARFRVIIPDLPSGVGDLGAWLRDFLEALGIEGAAIVVPDGGTIAALDLTLLDTE